MSDRPESAEPFNWNKLKTRRDDADLPCPRVQSGKARKKPAPYRTVAEVIAFVVVVGGTLSLAGWAMFRDRSGEESLQDLQDRLRYQEIISAPKQLADEMYERDPELKRLKQEMASDDPEVAEKAYRAAGERMNRALLRREDVP